MNQNNQASDTALMTVSLRALSNYEENEFYRTDDHIAELFIPAERKKFFSTYESRKNIKDSLPPGLYGYVIARTKYFDSIFKNALTHNIDQIVFLGAGYDTRPYRFKSIISCTRIFEIDSFHTQKNKLTILQSNRIEVPENISYISANFEKDCFISMLKENGYDTKKKTLFICEGVSFYLTKKANIRILQSIHRNTMPGSSLCLDFQTIRTDKDLIDTGLENESVKFGIKEGKIVDFFYDNGYSVTEHITPDIMEKSFLSENNEKSFCEISSIMNIVLLRNNE